MFQAIVTKYHGPTNTRGSRITATASAGRVTVPYHYGMNSDDNHRAAAEALKAKMAWKGDLAAGALPGDTGAVFVFTSHA